MHPRGQADTNKPLAPQIQDTDSLARLIQETTRRLDESKRKSLDMALKASQTMSAWGGPPNARY